MKKFVNLKIFFLLTSILTAALAGCASKLVVQSNPAGVDVYMTPPKSDKKIRMGTTPFEISEDSFKSEMRMDPHQLEYFQLTMQKEGFQEQKLLVPGMRFGHVETTIFVKMETAKEGLAAKELLQYLMNAQQFAQASDFYRAHEEVEKALKIDAKFARAISMKGAIYFVEKNYSESLKWYEKSLALDGQQQDVVKMVSHLRKKLQGEAQ